MARKYFEKKGTWTAAEDEKLLAIIADMEEKGLPVKWCLVSKRLPSRSPKQCRERYVYNLDPNICKEPWTKEEDALLIHAQSVLGNSWARISTLLHGRTENSTKTRFKSIQRAEKRLWKKAEDAKVLEMQDKLGCRWEEIAKYLPGRTKNAVKTRYRFLKGEVFEEEDQEDAESEDSPRRPGSPGQALHISEAEKENIAELFRRRLMEVEKVTLAGVNGISQASLPALPATTMAVAPSAITAPRPAPLISVPIATEEQSKIRPLRKISSEVRFSLNAKPEDSSTLVTSSPEHFPETPKNLIRRRESFDASETAPVSALSPSHGAKKRKIASATSTSMDTGMGMNKKPAVILEPLTMPGELLLESFSFDDVALSLIGSSSSTNTAVQLFNARRSSVFGSLEFAEACAQVASNWNLPSLPYEEAFQIAVGVTEPLL